MGSSGKIWKKVSIHAVVLEWLRGERHRIEAAFSDPRAKSVIFDCIDNADLGSPLQNRVRLRVLYMVRMDIIVELPPDTAWFMVSSFGHDDVMALNVIFAEDWNDGSGDFRIGEVARRRPIPLRAELPFPAMPILFGTARSGPFTIIEGNNRLVAYAGSGRSDYLGPVMIGISPTDCVWNGPPSAGRMLLLQDLIRDRGRPAQGEG